MKNNINALGMILFSIYSLLYLGFVLLTAFWPESMAMSVYGEVNLAVFYGFGLIISAFVLALVYGIFGKPTDSSARAEDSKREDGE